MVLEKCALALVKGLQSVGLSCRLSLHTLCVVTSAYFVQAGFVEGVSWIGLRFVNSDGKPSSVNPVWGLADGMVLFSLGYMCILGLETKSLNLVRWPTLVLFVYKGVGYFVKHFLRHLNDKMSTGRTRMSSLEWIDHFLLPSTHIVLVTLHLWGSLHSPKSSRLWMRMTQYVPLKTVERGQSVHHHHQQPASSTTSLVPTKKRKPPPLSLPLRRKRNIAYASVINSRRPYWTSSTSSLCPFDQESDESGSDHEDVWEGGDDGLVILSSHLK